MAEIISCAKDTQLHSFPELKQLSSSAHIDSNNGSDCRFFGSSKLFVRANKNTGIELLRIKDGEAPVDGSAPTRSIATVKKMMIDNLYCVACPKTASKDEIAIGLTSGTVRFMNYKKANFTKRFDSERITNSVTFMDFNATDDFLAAVYENGLVNVYGMKTSSKLHTLAFDKNTNKARFHPSKRFHMAVASDKGAVVLYDSQAKKTMFSQPTAHGAPCRDVGMVESFPDYVFSVGYDSVINVFDTRRKDVAYQIQSNYPFESLAIAEDGHHFAVGNLKGYVYGYDLRNLKQPLNMKQIHQSNVTSLTFVPKAKDGSSRRSMIELDESRKVSSRGVRISEGGCMANGTPEMVGLASNEKEKRPEQHDSFIGDIDQFMQRREPTLGCMSRLSTSSRLSGESPNRLAGNNLLGFLDDLSDCHTDPDDTGGLSESNQQHASGSTPEPEFNIDDSFVNTTRLIKRIKANGGGRPNASAGDRLHKKGMIDNLEHINEEASDIGETENEGTEAESVGIVAGARSETDNKAPHVSVSRVLLESQQENKALKAIPQQDTRKLLSVPSELSTPMVNGKENNSRSTITATVFRHENSHTTTTDPSTPNHLGPEANEDTLQRPASIDQQTVTTKQQQSRTGSSGLQQQQQLSGEIAELRKTMLDQFQKSTIQQVDAEQAMRSHLWMCMFNLWRETQQKLESIEQTVNAGFGLLLPRDEFAQQFISMRAENEALRNRLKELEEQGKGGK
ncbi:AGAP007817-PA-like protein [Anopheles sinensis]|uniref:AGAP007817-PA-like protein n=1 Tax=Anopheles sinensis TaxID=74873 RepID=A0A084VAE6_ANOSI|nr:AGAP007817-PA-like protein [Anopheles sinensis]